MKKAFLLITVFVLLLTACGAQQKPAETPAPTAAAEAPAQTAAEPFQKLRHAELTVKDYGTIKLELDEQSAPITTANFIKLAQDGFYDGLTFHRIMDGFMIQGGDPTGTGTGGSSETIKGEFAKNGVNNPISHVKGVISMARANAPDSASSQFFITVADSTFLDGSYAAFGRVTEGMEIAEQIAKDAKPIDNNGTIPAAQQPVIERIVITD
ncbi:MAG: peptidylprolyl isomerase [Oscillospiraceae bacterium]|nr:peptidylprolyl isomerase [Oscillospiraceae bacterium]